MYFFRNSNIQKHCKSLFLLVFLSSCTGQEADPGAEGVAQGEQDIDLELSEELATPVEVQGSELGNLKLGLLDDPFYNKLLNYLRPIEVTYPLDACPAIFPMATTGCAIYEFKGHLENLKHHTSNLFGNGGYFSDNPVEIDVGYNRIFKTKDLYPNSPEFVRISSLENVDIGESESQHALHVAVEFFFKTQDGKCRRDTVYEYASQGACPTSDQCDAFVHVLLAKDGKRSLKNITFPSPKKILAAEIY